MKAICGLVAWLGAVMVLAGAGPRAGGPRVVGYFPEWQTRYPVERIPADRLTHVNYAFAGIKGGECVVDNQDLALKHFAGLRALKAAHPHLKTLVSVGGWSGSPPFAEMARTAEGRERFARSCVAFIKEHGFDGVDIDWEFPGGGGVDPKVGGPEDTPNFTLLMKELRERLDEAGPGYLLTAATSARPAEYARMELSKVQGYMDFVNVMTYDYCAGFKETDHNAPLFAAREADARGCRPMNVEDTVRDYVAAGVPAGKVVLGVPFYGRAFGGVADENRGMYRPHHGEPVPAAGAQAGDWTYRTLVTHYIGKGPVRYWDERAKVPWLFDAKTGLAVTYDDAESVREKGKFARERGLGGVMFWEVTQDDEAGTLLSALEEGLGVK